MRRRHSQHGGARRRLAVAFLPIFSDSISRFSDAYIFGRRHFRR